MGGSIITPTAGDRASGSGGREGTNANAPHAQSARGPRCVCVAGRHSLPLSATYDVLRSATSCYMAQDATTCVVRRPASCISVSVPLQVCLTASQWTDVNLGARLQDSRKRVTRVCTGLTMARSTGQPGCPTLFLLANLEPGPPRGLLERSTTPGNAAWIDPT
jgi:hypothetical protein